MSPEHTPTPGLFTLVLHSHLPWLAHHGVWPVGEEWLYQAWGSSYLPFIEVLYDLRHNGYSDLLSLGVTPVLAAQLDDPYLLKGLHHWLGNWHLRAHEAADYRGSSGGSRTAHSTQAIRAMGRREHQESALRISEFESRWLSGFSPVLRPLLETKTIEILGGPLAHPFQPLLDHRLRTFSLNEGLADTQLRLGHRPAGIWAPECAYKPGMETEYARENISHFVVDGPTLHGDTALGRPVGESNVVAFGRDLTVSYKVWSPRSGYPGHSAYRDFHTFHHDTGFKNARVTGRHVDSEHKAPYDPERAARATEQHAIDFVDAVKKRLWEESERIGRPAHVVAAFDTELFGHWWYEGPQWLNRVLRLLPESGVHVGSLSTALAEGYVGDPVTLPPSSWGSGKDWSVWSGPDVEDLVQLNKEVTAETYAALDKPYMPCEEPNVPNTPTAEPHVPIDGDNKTTIIPWLTPPDADITPSSTTTVPDLHSPQYSHSPQRSHSPHHSHSPHRFHTRDLSADQLLREALLEVESDWAFLVSKKTAVAYARNRAHLHAHAMREIAYARRHHRHEQVERLTKAWRAADGPFPQLDARLLSTDTTNATHLTAEDHHSEQSAPTKKLGSQEHS